MLTVKPIETAFLDTKTVNDGVSLTRASNEDSVGSSLMVKKTIVNPLVRNDAPTGSDPFALTEAGEEAVIAYMEAAAYVTGLKDQSSVTVAKGLKATTDALSGVTEVTASRLNATKACFIASTQSTTQLLTDIIEPAADEAKLLSKDIRDAITDEARETTKELQDVVDPDLKMVTYVHEMKKHSVKKIAEGLDVTGRALSGMARGTALRIKDTHRATRNISRRIAKDTLSDIADITDEAKIVAKEISTNVKDAIEPAKEEVQFIAEDASKAVKEVKNNIGYGLRSLRPMRMRVMKRIKASRTAISRSIASTSRAIGKSLRRQIHFLMAPTRVFAEAIEPAREEASLIMVELSRTISSFSVRSNNTAKTSNRKKIKKVDGNGKAKIEKKRDKSDPEKKVKVQDKSQGKAQVKSRIKTKVMTNMEPPAMVDLIATSTPKVQTRAKSQIEAENKTKVESKVVGKVEAKDVESDVASKVESKAEAKVESKAEAKINANVEPESNVEAKDEALVEPKIEMGNASVMV